MAVYLGSQLVQDVHYNNTSVANMYLGTSPVKSLYDSSSELLFSRMTVQPDVVRKKQYDTLIKSLKVGGVWNKLDALYILAAHTAQAARLNIVAPTFDLVTMNSPIFTVDKGYTGDGTGAYISTGINPTSGDTRFKQDTGAQGGWSLTDATGAAAIIGGTAGMIAVNSILGRNGGGIQISVNDTGGSNLRPTVTTAAGHNFGSRRTSTSITVFKDGQALGSSGRATVPFEDFPFLLLRAGTGYSTLQLASWHLGEGLTGSELSSIYSAQQTYLQAIGVIS